MQYRNLEFDEETDTLPVGLQRMKLKPRRYEGHEARTILVLMEKVTNVSTLRLVITSLLFNPKDEDLFVDVKELHLYISDKSQGGYDVIVEHKSHPEGFKLEAKQSLDTSYKVDEWAYGGG
jgi:hypothetical protein